MSGRLPTGHANFDLESRPIQNLIAYLRVWNHFSIDIFYNFEFPLLQVYTTYLHYLKMLIEILIFEIVTQTEKEISRGTQYTYLLCYSDTNQKPFL